MRGHPQPQPLTRKRERGLDRPLPLAGEGLGPRSGKGGGCQRSRKSSEGFTLIEILVALVILSLGVGAGFAAISARGRAAESAEALSQAMVVAQGVLDAAGIDESLADGAGRWGAVEWQRKVAPVEHSEPPFRLYTVAVTASVDGRSLTLTSLRAEAVR